MKAGVQEAFESINRKFLSFPFISFKRGTEELEFKNGGAYKLFTVQIIVKMCNQIDGHTNV